MQDPVAERLNFAAAPVGGGWESDELGDQIGGGQDDSWSQAALAQKRLQSRLRGPVA